MTVEVIATLEARPERETDLEAALRPGVARRCPVAGSTDRGQPLQLIMAWVAAGNPVAGFVQTPSLHGKTSIRTLADEVTAFIHTNGLTGIDVLGSSRGARLVLELARRYGGRRGGARSRKVLARIAAPCFL